MLTKLVILGGMNSNELDQYLGRKKVRVVNNSNELFCKNEVAEFVGRVEPTSSTFYYLDD